MLPFESVGILIRFLKDKRPTLGIDPHLYFHIVARCCVLCSIRERGVLLSDRLSLLLVFFFPCDGTITFGFGMYGPIEGPGNNFRLCALSLIVGRPDFLNFQSLKGRCCDRLIAVSFHYILEDANFITNHKDRRYA